MQATHPKVITAAILPRRTAVTIALMVGFAVLTALSAQVRVFLPGTPVPITGQTLAVLLSGAALGSWAGAGSQLIYVTMGLVGLPVFAAGNGGWDYLRGPTLGYLVGFVVAAWLVGSLAERGQDRSVWSAMPAFLTGTVVIYVFGVTWLWWSLESVTTFQEALTIGLVPFVAGDLIKVALAGLALPAAWKLTTRPDR